MQIREIMTSHVTSCPPETTLLEVAVLMKKHNCGAIPVIDATTRKLLGIVTDRDIVCRSVA